MRGLVEKKEANTVYLVVKHGTICQESRNPKDGYEPVEVINPETKVTTIKYIKPYDRVEALITNIEWSDREWDGRPYRSWRISMDAAGTPCVLELPFESRVSTRFMKLAESISYTDPVEFRAWLDRDNKTAFIVKQNGQNVPQKYTRENPGECPEPVKRVTGKWSFDDQAEFLHERMMNIVIPRVHAAVEMAPRNGHEAPDENNSDSFDDDETSPF